jgi:hypothetical protein
MLCVMTLSKTAAQVQSPMQHKVKVSSVYHHTGTQIRLLQRLAACITSTRAVSTAEQ